MAEKDFLGVWSGTGMLKSGPTDRQDIPAEVKVSIADGVFTFDAPTNDSKFPLSHLEGTPQFDQEKMTCSAPGNILDRGGSFEVTSYAIGRQMVGQIFSAAIDDTLVGVWTATKQGGNEEPGDPAIEGTVATGIR